MRKTGIAVLFCLVAVLYPALICSALSKVKIRGYITAKPDAQTLKILDDVIHLSSSTSYELHNSGAAVSKPLSLADLTPGVLIEAEGRWGDKHQFDAEKITCDAEQFDKEIKEYAYLQTEPEDAKTIAAGQLAHLKADGELLVIDDKTKRDWKSGESNGAQSAEVPQFKLVGRQLRYEGVRLTDGHIEAEKIELGPAPPADAYKIPGNLIIARSVDPQTKIDVLEIRKGKNIQGRMKLFSVKEVQEYVTHLGTKLLPPSADVTTRALEFRFFVVEDPSINAAALPDGTIFVNTGLLGAMDNESQLAFVLSHEIAHVLQAHHWREANETRSKRVLLIIAAVAAQGFIGDLGGFLVQLGLEALVNGYSRRIENQADRLGMQNIVDHGYDPRGAVTFFRTMIDHYGGRSTSAIWSNHDSSLLRGSFLTTQMERQYPQGHFDHAIVDTEEFKAMKEAMGPVKIM